MSFLEQAFVYIGVSLSCVDKWAALLLLALSHKQKLEKQLVIAIVITATAALVCFFVCFGCTPPIYASSKQIHSANKIHLSSLGQEAWKHAIQKARAMPDPWAEFHLEDIETELCIRYRCERLAVIGFMGVTVCLWGFPNHLRCLNNYIWLPELIKLCDLMLIAWKRFSAALIDVLAAWRLYNRASNHLIWPTVDVKQI